jgi:hypothetical protein
VTDHCQDQSDGKSGHGGSPSVASPIIARLGPSGEPATLVGKQTDADEHPRYCLGFPKTEKSRTMAGETAEGQRSM